MTPYEVRKRMHRAFRNAFDLPDEADRAMSAALYCDLMECLTLADMHEDGNPWALAVLEQKLVRLKASPMWKNVEEETNGN